MTDKRISLYINEIRDVINEFIDSEIAKLDGLMQENKSLDYKEIEYCITRKITAKNLLSLLEYKLEERKE